MCLISGSVVKLSLSPPLTIADNMGSHKPYLTDCPVTPCQYFRIFFPTPFPVENVWTWVRFLTSIKLRIFEIQDPCMLQHRKLDGIIPIFWLLCADIPCFHGNLGEWGPATAVANSADHRDKLINQEIARTVLLHVSTEMWRAPSRWKYIYNCVLSGSGYVNDLEVLREV
jgi:hypothetical protein